MKVIGAALRFLVFTNIYISACVLCFTSKTALILYGSPGNLHVNLLAFSSTMFFYCFHRVYRRYRLLAEEHKEERHHWVDERKRFYYIITGLAFLIFASQLFYMPLRVFLVLAPVGIIAAGYSIPVIKTKKGFIRIRDISWLKALWIGIAYAWLTTFLPIAYQHPLHTLLSPDVLLLFTENLLFIFVLAVPFDIRDLNYDKRNGVNTLPVQMGIKGSIQLCIWLLIVFVILVMYQTYFLGLNRFISAALCLSAFQIALIIPLSKPERPNLFFPFAIESSMILQWAFVLLAINM